LNGRILPHPASVFGVYYRVFPDGGRAREAEYRAGTLRMANSVDLTKPGAPAAFYGRISLGYFSRPARRMSPAFYGIAAKGQAEQPTAVGCSAVDKKAARRVV
jgi:hypothetical protein